MSNKHCGPDIVKYFVVEPTGGGGTTTGATGNFFVCSGTTFLSTISGCTNGVDFNGNTFYNSGDVFFNGVITACTGIHTSNIYGCSPITVHDELILLNKLTLSAVTQDDTLTQILGRDNSTGEVKYRDISSIAPAAKLQNTYFVSSLSGDNSTALVGDINNPWKTITEARNQAVADGYSNSLIHVYSGEYLEDEIQYENGNFYFEPNSKVTTQRTASGGTTSIFRLGQTLVYESNTYSANTCNVYGYGDFSVSATTDTDSFGGFILSMLGDSNSYFEFNDAYVHSGEAFYAGGNSILTLEGHDILLDPSGSDGLDFSDTSTTLINVNDIVGGNSHWNIHYRTSFAGKSVVNFNKLIGSDQLIAFDRFMQPTAEITMNFNLIEHTGGSQYIINSGDNLGAKVTLNGDFYAPYGNGILLYHDAGEYNINGNITCRDTALLSIDTLSPSNNFVLNYNGDIVTSGVTSDFSSNGGVELNKITVNLNGSLTNLSLGALSNGINIDSNSILNIGNFDINVVSGNTIGTSSSNVVNINHSLSINKPFSSGITATGLFNYTGTTNVGDLVIYNTPTNDNSLTQILGRNSTTGDVEYRDVSSIISGATSQDTFVTGSTLSGSTLLLSRNDGVELTTDLSSILFTGNTSGDCITDLYITNLYGCSPITVNDTLSLTNNARLNINATSSFTLAVESYDNNIATFRDIDGEDIFFAQGSLANQDLVFGFGDFGDAYGYAGYTLDTVLNQHNFTNGNLYLGNVSTFNTDTKLYVDGNAKVTDSLSATTFYGDGSNLTGISTDNFYVSGGTYNSGTDDINFVGNSTETTFDVDLSSLVSSVSGDTFVVSGNANAATSQLTFTNNSGGTFTVANSAALFSDNDINVTGGTYNPSNGCITFGTNSGTTFDVCGFVTGFTDSYTTDAYLSGTEVRFDNSVEGVNYYNVDLNPLLSGKTDNTTFNTYTANTQTILDGKIDSANNVGGANEFFKDKSGTTLNFRTLSGGSNTTVSTVGDVVKVDVTVPSTTNTFVTGGTLNSGTLILERQDGTVTITGFTTDLDTYVTGGTVSVTATNDNNDGTIGLFYKNSEGVPHTLPFKDTFITGGTYDNGSSTIEFTKNDSTTFDVDLSSIDVNNTFSTGGTVTQSATSGSTDVTIQITGNDGFTPYNITGLTDTFVNDFSYSAQTFTITQNDGSTFETEVESIDLANILSGVTFDIATSGSISATTFNGGTFNGTFVGDGSGLTGITDNNTFVTGTTFNSNEATLTRNDGFDVFKFSGGSNVNLSNPSTNQIKIDVSLPSTMNTFTTGFTYNDANTLTIRRNDGINLSTSINTMTGLTVNGDITVVGTSNLNAVTATTIDFDLNYTGTTAEGRLSWNFEDATLDLGMGGGNVTQQIGQEIYYRVKNQSGATISNGSVVRNAGSVGASGRILGEYMIADGTYPFSKTLGIATEDILNGSDGLVTEFGVVRGLNTTGSLYGESWSDGDVLYVSPTIPGGLTNVEPQAPNQILEMGIVLFSNVGNGSIFVDRHLSTKLGDISDVQTTGATNGDLIVYNSATTVWDYSKTLTGDYDINGSLSATTYFGDGSNLTGISSDDNFVTGGTFSSETLTLNRQNGSVTITGFTSDSNTFVTGFTYNDANTFTISNNDGTSFNSSINIMTGFTVNNGVGDGFVTINSTSGQELEINQRGVNFNYSTPNIQVGTTGANMMIGSTGGIGSYPSGTYPGLNLNTTTGDIFLFNGGYGGTGAVMDFQGGNIRDIHDIQSSGNWPLKLYGGPGPNDGNDGIQMYTADNLNVYTKKFEIKADTGTPNAYFTNINNFGVNTTTPQHTLDVNGTTRLLGLTANTLNLVTTPTLNNSATDILVRNSSTGEVEYRPVSGITPDTNTFVVGGTYVDSTNTIALLRNDGNFVNVTGVTNTYVTGGTVSVPATDSSNDGTIGLFYKDSDGTPRTLPFKDTFVTGTTFGSNQATLTRNDGVDVLKITGDTNVVLSNPSTNQIKVGLDLGIKSGTIRGTEFTGNPKTCKIIFTTAYSDTDYSINITGGANRTYTYQDKTTASFVINTNANSSFTDFVDWVTIKYGEQ